MLNHQPGDFPDLMDSRLLCLRLKTSRPSTIRNGNAAGKVVSTCLSRRDEPCTGRWEEKHGSVRVRGATESASFRKEQAQDNQFVQMQMLVLIASGLIGYREFCEVPSSFAKASPFCPLPHPRTTNALANNSLPMTIVPCEQKNRQECLLQALMNKPRVPVSPHFGVMSLMILSVPLMGIPSRRLSYRANVNTAPMASTSSPNPYSWPILMAAPFVGVLAGAPAVPVVLPVAVEAGAELVVAGAVLAWLALEPPQTYVTLQRR